MLDKQNLIVSSVTCDALVAEITKQVTENVKELIKEHISNEQILTTKSACEILNVSSKTLSRWSEQGCITQYGIGNRNFYKLSDILERDLIRTN